MRTGGTSLPTNAVGVGVNNSCPLTGASFACVIRLFIMAVFPFFENQYGPDYPSSLWWDIVDSLTEAHKSWFASLTQEEQDEHLIEEAESGYVADYWFFDKEDVLGVLCESLENPDWVTPDICIVPPPLYPGHPDLPEEDPAGHYAQYE